MKSSQSEATFSNTAGHQDDAGAGDLMKRVHSWGGDGSPDTRRNVLLRRGGDRVQQMKELREFKELWGRGGDVVSVGSPRGTPIRDNTTMSIFGDGVPADDSDIDTAASRKLLDVYGLELTSIASLEAMREFHPFFLVACMIQEEHCKNLLRSDHDSLSSIVNAGIAPRYRALIWSQLAGIDVKMGEPRYSFEALVVKEAADEANQQIEKDLGRTFIALREKVPMYTQKLRNVLRAYASLKPSVGYAQGMNLLVGSLLIFYPGHESKAFRMLQHIMDDVLCLYFVPGMVGVMRDATILERYIQKYLPKLFFHFQLILMDVPLLCARWFIPMFLNTVPSEAAFRVWDRIFHQGPAAIFKFALAILAYFQTDLLEHSNEIEMIVSLDDVTTPLWNIAPVLRLMDEYTFDSASIKLQRANLLSKPGPPPSFILEDISIQSENICLRCPSGKHEQEEYCIACTEKVHPRLLCFDCEKRFKLMEYNSRCSKCGDEGLLSNIEGDNFCPPCAKGLRKVDGKTFFLGDIRSTK